MEEVQLVPRDKGRRQVLSEALDAAQVKCDSTISLGVALRVCPQLVVPLLHLSDAPPALCPRPQAEPALRSFPSTEVSGLITG